MKSKIFKSTAVTFMLLAMSCSDDSMSDLGALVDNFIPSISNGWKDENSSNHYLLAADSENVPKGTFTGQLQYGSPDSTSVPELSGSFVHEKIQFTFTSGAPSGITYKGVIDTLHPNHMRLANTLDSLHDSLYLVQE